MIKKLKNNNLCYMFFFIVLSLSLTKTTFAAGLFTGVDASLNIININFNGSLNVPTSASNDDWIGKYKESVNDFTLDFRSGPGVDFNNWDNDFDIYKFSIKSFWDIEFSVSIRDNALFSDEDIFKFAGTAQHTAGENLPHTGDSKEGNIASFGSSATSVKDLVATDLKDTALINGLLGGITGKYWVYYALLPIKHPNASRDGDHLDWYETYFLADVSLVNNSQNSYRILMTGKHVISEPSTLILLVMCVVGGMFFQRKNVRNHNSV